MSFEDTWKDITDQLSQAHVPEIFLAVIGVLVILLVAFYLKDKEGGYYKLVYFVSLVAAAITVIFLITGALKVETGPLIILCIACFTILVRPFRDTHLVAIFALFVLVLVYIILDGINGVEFLEQFWVKLVIALIAGVIVYLIGSFIEAIVMLFGKLFNWWPMLLCIGVLCIIEAILIATGNGSIISLITK